MQELVWSDMSHRPARTGGGCAACEGDAPRMSKKQPAKAQERWYALLVFRSDFYPGEAGAPFSEICQNLNT